MEILRLSRWGTTLVSSLKKEVCNSFVATLCHLNVTDRDILNWLSQEIGIQAEVERLNLYLFWIKPISHHDFSRMVETDFSLKGTFIRSLDRWMEVLGPVLRPTWVRLEGIPLHAWDERVFHSLGECLGVLMEIDDEATKKITLDKVRLLILRDPQR